MQEKELIKYIKGEANPEEVKEILKWIRENKEHQKRYAILKAKYVASNLGCLDHEDVDLSYKKFSSKRNKRKSVWYQTAVAAVLLPLLIWQSYTYFQNDGLIVNQDKISTVVVKNIATNYGGQKTINLPDGSTVILNSGSSISYPENFTDTLRQVTLKGEAYFDIERDVTKPFIVQTDHLKVRVLGTSFNVKSYPKDDKIETTLVSGKVEVIQEETEAPVVLTPSQRATFHKEESDIKVDQVDSDKIVAWKQGKLVFDKTPLKQVVQDLKRKYDVEFVIESDSLLHYRYTGEFDNLSLEDVLELIKLSSSIDYKRKNNKIMLNSE
ncbi:FecR family protein [Aquimarina spongiae]|uniref:FecR family protein n=1 Tax=Aquimarina spongiae TaxID=570521 RepID=A0A1M6ATW1_9FLAO|nr:FecR domain-containing protein [Aquimarina spongiae]SHI39900.1 FecR family protein [Aquimarina spongiae]